MKEKLVLVASLFAFSTVWAAQPIAWWTMTELDAQGRVPDATGNGHDLALGADVTLQDDATLGCKVLRMPGTEATWAKTVDKIAVGSRSFSVWMFREEGSVGPLGPSVNRIPYLLNHFSGTGVNWPDTGIGIRYVVDGTSAKDGAWGRGHWDHYVWTVEITDVTDGVCTYNHRVYINSTERTYSVDGLTAPADKIYQIAENVVLGNQSEGDTRPHFGMIGDARLYDVALTAAEVQELYLETLRGRPKHAVGFWRMDAIDTDGEGKRSIADATGKGVPLAVGDGVEIVTRDGNGKALNYLDKTTAYGVAKSPVQLSDFTLGMWIRPGTGMNDLASTATGNKRPFVFSFRYGGKDYFRAAFNELENYGFRRFSIADFGGSGYVTAGNVYNEKGTWSHFAVVVKAEKNGETWSATPKFYMNGRLVSTERAIVCDSFASSGLWPKDMELVLGNDYYPANWAFWGQMDDVAFISGALTDEEVKDLYLGMPQPTAGVDFASVEATTRLRGALPVVQTGSNGRAVATASTAWTLVSAPQGGEGAVIENPGDLETRVTLPVCGAYVFRLTATGGTLSLSDTVQVTRVAPAANVPPTCTIASSFSGFVGLPRTLCATASDPDHAPGALRITWSRVSGPSAVLFEPREGIATAATFYAPGQYVLRVTADDGADTASAEVTVNVSNPTVNLTDGLMVHVPFRDVTCKSADNAFEPWTKYFDRTYAGLADGVEDYALQVKEPFLYSFIMLHATGDRKGGGWTLDEVDASGNKESSNKVTNPYRAFSCWLRYDAASDTQGAFHSVIFEQPYNLGLLYDRENGRDVLRFYQQNGGATGDGFDTYEITSADMGTDWVHVYALFDRINPYSSNVSELWINGNKQTPKTKNMGYGRPRSGYLELGGLKCEKGTAGFNDHWTDAQGNSLSRTFPGRIDEFRMYSRNLNEAEIKTLAAMPCADINHPPAVEAAQASGSKAVRTAYAVTGLAADDGRPEGSQLTYAWQVLSGDASKLTFGDASARETTLTATRGGTYVIALKVSDGARETWSDALSVTIDKPGMVLLLR